MSNFCTGRVHPAIGYRGPDPKGRTGRRRRRQRLQATVTEAGQPWAAPGRWRGGRRGPAPPLAAAPLRRWCQSPVQSGAIRTGPSRPTGDERRDAQLGIRSTRRARLLNRHSPAKRISPGAPGKATGCRSGHDPGGLKCNRNISVPLATAEFRPPKQRRPGDSLGRVRGQQCSPNGAGTLPLPNSATRGPSGRVADRLRGGRYLPDSGVLTHSHPINANTPGAPRTTNAARGEIPGGVSAEGTVARASPGSKSAAGAGHGRGAGLHPPRRAGVPNPGRRSSPCGCGR